jgi:hypothetical protein
MRLEIGSRSYELRLSPGPLTFGGIRTATLCDHQRRQILVSSTVPRPMRTQLTALAITEAWKRQMIQRPPIAFVGDVS